MESPLGEGAAETIAEFIESSLYRGNQGKCNVKRRLINQIFMNYSFKKGNDPNFLHYPRK